MENLFRTADVALRRVASARMCLALFLIALVVRVAHAIFMAQSVLFWQPTVDELELYTTALTFAGGDWLGESLGPFFRPQNYSYTIALVMSLVGRSYMVVHAVNLIADSLAVPIWYLVARRAFPRVPAAIGALLVALYWPLVYFSARGHMEPYSIFISAVFFLMLVRHGGAVARGGAAWGWLFAAGLVAGYMVMMRPQTAIVMPGIAIAVMWLHWARARRMVPALVAGAVLTFSTVLAMSPYTIRHWVMYDMFLPLGTNGTLNFHFANNDQGWNWANNSPGIGFRIYQQVPVIDGGITEPTTASVLEYWRQQNAAFLRERPIDFLRGVGSKFIEGLNAYEVHCLQTFEYIRGLSPVLRILPGFGVLLPFGFAGAGALVWCVGARSRRPRLCRLRHWVRALLIIWGLSYLASSGLFMPISRHRLPALMPMLLIAGWALWHLARLIAARRWSRLLRWLPGLMLAVAITRLPVIPEWMLTHERWWTQTNIGVAHVLGGTNPMMAEQAFARATEIMPDRLESWLQLAAVRAGQGDFEGAIEAQRRVAVLLQVQYPAFYMIEAEVLTKLAVYQLKGGRLDEAEATVRHVLALVPGALPPQSVLEAIAKARATSHQPPAPTGEKQP